LVKATYTNGPHVESNWKEWVATPGHTIHTRSPPPSLSLSLLDLPVHQQTDYFSLTYTNINSAAKSPSLFSQAFIPPSFPYPYTLLLDFSLSLLSPFSLLLPPRSLSAYTHTHTHTSLHRKHFQASTIRVNTPSHVLPVHNSFSQVTGLLFTSTREPLLTVTAAHLTSLPTNIHSHIYLQTHQERQYTLAIHASNTRILVSISPTIH
jgi:hypothetical protein